MGNNYDKLKKRLQDREAEIEKLSSDLTKLEDQRQQLEAEINAAIDRGDAAQAEKLVNQMHTLEVKIEVGERTVNRKSAQRADTAEITDAANRDTADYQRKVEQAETAVQAAKRAYLSKLIDLAALVNEAWDSRTKYCSLVAEIEDPSTINSQTSDFDHVNYHIAWDRKDDEQLREINPEALTILSSATANKHNLWIGRDTNPIVPNVTITKR